MEYEKLIHLSLNESIKVKQTFIQTHVNEIMEAAKAIVRCFKSGGKLLLCGNGGSAADAQHIAAEFVNRFQMERPPLAALALTTDTSVITSIGNDYSFEDIFSKQIQALARRGDVVVCISTGGNSPNVIKAALQACDSGLNVIGMSGSVGQLREISDIAFCVDSPVTARIQESHITLAHILCDLTERMLFEKYPIE
ncbi:MAG: D-sedoheptulose 7-phosphate isomerase [Desulfamplus sp.]|nr:D-sedoheptulose 7-phosphate isomerase [Desulfamplus sp.]